MPNVATSFPISVNMEDNFSSPNNSFKTLSDTPKWYSMDGNKSKSTKPQSDPLFSSGNFWILTISLITFGLISTWLPKTKSISLAQLKRILPLNSSIIKDPNFIKLSNGHVMDSLNSIKQLNKKSFVIFHLI